jgi:low affinity Fe/Cu permease
VVDTKFCIKDRAWGVAMQSESQRRPAASWFQSFATQASIKVGTRWAFLAAILLIVVWAATGPFFRFSDTWQLVINTGTTIVTFLMVFLIQNTQNRDARAIHLKLDEVIRSIHQAHNEMIDIEHLSDEELETLAKQYERFRKAVDHRRNQKPA